MCSPKATAWLSFPPWPGDKPAREMGVVVGDPYPTGRLVPWTAPKALSPSSFTRMPKMTRVMKESMTWCRAVPTPVMRKASLRVGTKGHTTKAGCPVCSLGLPSPPLGHDICQEWNAVPSWNPPL